MLISCLHIYNFSVSLNYVYADSLLAIFIPLLYLSLISKSKNKILVLSLILSFLYFSKSTMLFIFIIFPFLILIFEKNYNFYNRTIPIIFAVISICVWGFFGLLKTGTFPVGNKILSASATGLSFVLNEDFKNYSHNFKKKN